MGAMFTRDSLSFPAGAPDVKDNFESSFQDRQDSNQSGRSITSLAFGMQKLSRIRGRLSERSTGLAELEARWQE
ncbi:hypothetical protein B9Z55_020398 [Caenorhabditis nigoni]|uniref:Uncharacterized protein n=1 Tax=Caenorhabditis nigoni TaxID=1611254 RepID=A0A2G5TML1_9PELO|nr:hypothetical protein B9Z55_020398 [Caenorhabditis nigoni]